jgi:site-specific DNA recombinase
VLPEEWARGFGHSLVQLRGEIAKLTARRQEISDTINHLPRAPPPATIDRIRAHLADIIAAGTPAERKAMIEALVAEIRITGNQAVPVFKIPEPDRTLPGDPAATTESKPPVRAMVRLVDRRLQHTNTLAVTIGPDLPLPLARERLISQA